MNRNHLKFVFADNEPIRFDVDKENKTVTCSIDGFFYSEYPFREMVLKEFSKQGFEIDATEDDYILGFTQFVTKAKCYENDTFDEVVGKRIAESKCKEKIYTKARKMCYAITKKSVKLATEMSQLENYYSNLNLKEFSHKRHLDKQHNHEGKEN